MRLIGLTGGIAAGKSLVARRFAEGGAVVIDADRLAREVVEPGQPALADIAERFGPGVLTATGELDRAALGAIVFADPEALRDLNTITHPRVRARGRDLLDSAVAADPEAIVVYDVPLLIETNTQSLLGHPWDLVVVVMAPEAERVRRLVELRGMAEADAWSRVRSQASDEQRHAAADLEIDSGGSIEQTRANADAAWHRIRQL